MKQTKVLLISLLCAFAICAALPAMSLATDVPEIDTPPEDVRFPISYATITNIVDRTYTGVKRYQSPVITYNGDTLVKNVDYKLSYTNNLNAGTATVTITGIGYFKGTVNKTFTIKQHQLSTTTISLNATKFYYTGQVRKPTVTVKIDSTVLTEGTDYTLSYSSGCIKAGTYYVYIKPGKNLKGSTIKQEFTILKTPISAVNVAYNTYRYYTGKAISPLPTLTYRGATYTKGTDYSITYSSGRKTVGKYTFTIKGINNMSGSKTYTFYVIPNKTSITEATSVKTTSATIKWSTLATECSGYQIRYSTSSSMSNAKSVYVSGISTASKKISSLVAGTTYYVQIRSYKTVSSTKYHSGWSDAFAFTTLTA